MIFNIYYVIVITEDQDEQEKIHFINDQGILNNKSLIDLLTLDIYLIRTLFSKFY